MLILLLHRQHKLVNPLSVVKSFTVLAWTYIGTYGWGGLIQGRYNGSQQGKYPKKTSHCRILKDIQNGDSG